jgi:hypothetical protein
VPSAGPPGPSDPEPTGVITGAVLRPDGRVLAGRWLEFVEPGRDLVVAPRKHASVDEHGFYLVEVPAGRWDAWFLHGKHSPVARAVGSVVVGAGEVVHWDVVVDGERSLRGEFALAAEDVEAELEDGQSQPFEVELRLAGSEELLVRAELSTAPEDGRRDEPALEDVPRAAPRSRFELDLLPARLVELRIVLPGEFRHPVTGEAFPMFVRRTVDLHAGDVTLPREELRYADFFAATRERLAREGK